MTELAVNQYGEAFILPIEARHWLVRRMSDVPRGGPMSTFGADGRPILIPIETTLDQFHALLREQQCPTGRYRLDALDGAQAPIKGLAAYLPFPPTVGRSGSAGRADGGEAPAVGERLRNGAAVAGPVWSTGGAWPLPVPAHLSGAEYLLGEALRGQIAMNAATTGALVQLQSGMAGLVTAAAELVRAADGAGLPKRKPAEIREAPAPRMPQVIVQQVAPPMAYEDDDEDEEEDAEPAAPPKGPGWQDKLGEVFSQLAPMAAMMLQSKLGDLVGGGMMGGGGMRNAAPAPAPMPESESAPEPEPEPEIDLSPAAWSHLQLVESRLDVGQTRTLRDELARMDPAARRDFALSLMSLKLEAACDHVVGRLAVLDARRARAQATAQRAAMAPEPVRTDDGPPPGAGPGFAGPEPGTFADDGDLSDALALDEETAAALGLHGAAYRSPAAGAPVEGGERTRPANQPLPRAVVPAGYEVVRTVRGANGRTASHIRPMRTDEPTEGLAPMAMTRMVEALQAGVGAGSPIADLIGAFPGGAAGVGAALGQLAPELMTGLQHATAPATAVPPAAAMARLMEILPRLAPEERPTAQMVAMQLPDDVRRGLMAKLVAVPLDEAVAIVKDILAKHAALRGQ